jgi:ribosome maturation factor RimP
VPPPHRPPLETLARRVADTTGFRVVEAQIQTHRHPCIVLVQIRTGDGGDVTLDDCAAFSGALAEAMEAEELLSEAYVLEISSPGLSDTLVEDRDFHSFRGFPIEVRFRDSSGAECTRAGLLLERDDAFLHLNVRGRRQRIPRQDVLTVSLTRPSE